MERSKSGFAICLLFATLVLLAACGGSGPWPPAQDAALTNHKTGIDTTFAGSAGTDYQEEYFFSDKLISDRKVVYIKSTTAISLSHNARNISYAGSGETHVFNSEYVPASGGNVGTIRYKIDRDLQWGRMWGDAGPSNYYDFNQNTIAVTEVNNPAYTSPFTLASVAGITGPVGTIKDVGNYYWRGILDDVGDEWHVLTVADDDRSFITSTGNEASDGKVILFVVNPKTPCLTITSTGDAQFYTTPPKNYFIPKIHNQTTYFSAGTGSVTFTLHDINGNNTFYRINGGSWSAGAATVTLTAASFSTGSNTLEYYYAGNQAYTKTRIVVKDPGFPSDGEYFLDENSAQVPHGELMWGAGNWTAISARLDRAPYASVFGTLSSNDNTLNPLARFSTYYHTGQRIMFADYAIANAVVAKKRGWTATSSGDSVSHAQYAKRMLMDNERNLDPVGFEISHSLRTQPTRELFSAGYYNVNAMYSLAFTYDILIANYKSTQQTGGITPIEDYFIRDMLAGISFEAMMQMGKYTFKDTTPAMWGTARHTGGLIAALAIPAYSTPYRGTSGFNGTTTVYPWTPFPDTPLTWKKAFFDNDAPLVGYPNLEYRLGIEEYNVTSDGTFDGLIGYTGEVMMGHVFSTTENIINLYWPNNTKFTRLNQLWLKNANGVLYGTADTVAQGAVRNSQIRTYNSRFAKSANIGKPWMKANTTGDTEGYSIYRGGAYALVWYDDSDVPYTGLSNAKASFK